MSLWLRGIRVPLFRAQHPKREGLDLLHLHGVMRWQIYGLDSTTGKMWREAAQAGCWRGLLEDELSVNLKHSSKSSML